MKPLIFMSIVTLAISAVFVSGVMAQQQSAPSPVAEKPKLEKFSGAIEKVNEVEKTFEVKHKVKKEEKTLAFAIDDKTKITRGKKALTLADLKKGMRVSIEYKKDGDENVAAAIKVAAKKTKSRKAERKPAEPEKK
jgi:hypothetical protein